MELTWIATQNLSMTLCAAYFPDATKSAQLGGTVTAALMGALAFVATVLRLAGRWVAMSGRLGADDWLIIASTVCEFALVDTKFPLTSCQVCAVAISVLSAPCEGSFLTKPFALD